MRLTILAITLTALAVGCSHLQLERSTLRQTSTISDLQYRQAMNNLAVYARNPLVLPSFAIVTAGAAQVSDTAGTTSELGFTSLGFDHELWGLSGTRNIQENWSLDPVRVPERLEAMRCAFQWTIGTPQSHCDECVEKLKHFNVLDQLAKIPPGWFHVGRKHDVPKCVCYVGRCGDTYVWVTPDGMDALTRFTLVLLDIATVELASLEPEAPTQTVETYKYNDKGQLSEVTKKTVPAPKTSDGPRTTKVRRDLYDPIRSLINLQRR